MQVVTSTLKMAWWRGAGVQTPQGLKLFTLLDLCVSSLRRGHANLLCIVPILTDDPRRESKSLVGDDSQLAKKKNGWSHASSPQPEVSACHSDPLSHHCW